MAADTMLAELRAAAGPDMYRRNAFRITGVATDATRQEIRMRQRLIVATVAAGADIELGHELEISEQSVRAAFDALLGDSRRRLVGEVFWLWGEPVHACDCNPRLHRAHDAAVTAHCAVLDAEAGADTTGADPERMWRDAALHWREALRRSDFWDHLRHRIIALNDHALDAALVDTLRAEVPKILVEPLVRLAVTDPQPARLISSARAWPVPAPVLDDLLEQAAEPLLSTVSAVLAEAFGLLDRKEFAAAADQVERSAVPPLRRLEVIVPAACHRRPARLRNQSAVLLNNCALAVAEHPDSNALDRAMGWLDTALELAVDDETRRAITANAPLVAMLVRRAQPKRPSRPARERQPAALPAEQVRRSPARPAPQVRRSPARPTAQVRRSPARPTAQVRKSPARPTAQVRKSPTGPTARVRQRYKQRAMELRRNLRRGYAEWGERAGRCLRPVADLLIRIAARCGVPDVQIYHLLQAGRVLVALLAAIVFTLGVKWVVREESSPPGGTTVWAAHASDNVPIGRCISGTENTWMTDDGMVHPTDCARPHWAEVLGYPQLAPAPSPYPGDDQSKALTWFDCTMLMARQGLDTTTNAVSDVYRDRANWNTGDRDAGTHPENYAVCIVHRRDDTPLPGGGLIDPRRQVPPVVWADLLAPDIADDPPVGSCVGSTESAVDASPHNAATVPCDAPHWAQIVGYPVLYDIERTWPGDAAVEAAAQAACSHIAQLPNGFHVSALAPDQSWWQRPQDRKYAACLAFRTDGQSFTGSIR